MTTCKHWRHYWKIIVLYVQLMLMMFRTLATVINCPQKVQEINFTESKKIVSLSLFAPLPTIYGQSCDGLNLTVSFPVKEIEWNRNIQQLELTTKDLSGRSQKCVIRVRTKGINIIYNNSSSYSSLRTVAYGFFLTISLKINT